MTSFEKKLLDLTVSDKQSKFTHGENAPTCVGHVLTIAPSTKDTLWFDLISSRDLGLGNERKSFVEYMYRPPRVDNFFIRPRSFINSSDSIERKVLEAFLGLIRRLPLLYFKI